MGLELNLAGHHKSHNVNQIYYHQLKQTAVCYLNNYETILKRFHENHNLGHFGDGGVTAASARIVAAVKLMTTNKNEYM